VLKEVLKMLFNPNKMKLLQFKPHLKHFGIKWEDTNLL